MTMEMADVIVIFEAGQSDRFDDEALAASFFATNVERPTEGAISCTIPADMVNSISHRPGVAYVRRVQAYLGSTES
jgi:hypothetical protein